MLEAEPRLVLGVKLHELGALVAVVVLVGGAVGIPAFGEDENVYMYSEQRDDMQVAT